MAEAFGGDKHKRFIKTGAAVGKKSNKTSNKNAG